MKTVAVLACCKKKLPTGATAEELYQGQLFKAQLAYARTLVKSEHIYIASAQYGLVSLKHLLLPYELSLSDMNKQDREAWAARVVTCLRDLYPTHLHVHLMAGGVYQEALKPQFGRLGISFEIPHPLGLGYGQQVQWYKEAVK